jgi:hypothetical protein
MAPIHNAPAKSVDVFFMSIDVFFIIVFVFSFLPVLSILKTQPKKLFLGWDDRAVGPIMARA